MSLQSMSFRTAQHERSGGHFLTLLAEPTAAVGSLTASSLLLLLQPADSGGISKCMACSNQLFDGSSLAAKEAEPSLRTRRRFAQCGSWNLLWKRCPARDASQGKRYWPRPQRPEHCRWMLGLGALFAVHCQKSHEPDHCTRELVQGLQSGLEASGRSLWWVSSPHAGCSGVGPRAVGLWSCRPAAWLDVRSLAKHSC